MKFKARITVEREYEIVAENVAEAAVILCRDLAYEPTARLLGVIPFDQSWPDTAAEKPRPPRNTPPSGSPGTPTLDAQPEPVTAVAA